MAFDFGLERIGVAIGNTMLQIPHPLATITGNNKYVKLEQIAALVDKWRPQLLVIGMPCVSEGEHEKNIHETARLQKAQLVNSINNFKRMLHNKFGLAIELINEDYSSVVAKLQLHEQGVASKAHKGKLDQLAACNIMQTYFSTL